MSETRFRWVGRPSEEALLGLSGGQMPRPNGPRPAPSRFPFPVADADATPAKHRRIGARELAAIGALAAFVWLVLHVAGWDVPSRSPGPLVPTVAASEVTRTLALDRRGHTSRPRTRRTDAEKAVVAAAATGKAAGAEEARTTPPPPTDDEDGPPEDGSSPSPPPPPPPTEPSDPPLLEANVPGVGSVTVEQADLPDADEVLPETLTLPAP
jgi:hypothetical protein